MLTGKDRDLVELLSYEVILSVSIKVAALCERVSPVFAYQGRPAIADLPVPFNA